MGCGRRHSGRAAVVTLALVLAALYLLVAVVIGVLERDWRASVVVVAALVVALAIVAGVALIAWTLTA